MNNRIEVLVGKLMANKILERPWIHLTVNFITKLPLVAGKYTILVVCNKLSKMTHFIVTTEEMIVERLVRLFRDNMWKLHELLESVVSDRKIQFAVELTKKSNRMLGIEYLWFFFDHRQKLFRVVSDSRVCSKQQDTFSNQCVSIYSELW